MENTILKVSNLTKLYPGVRALDDISLEINRGEVRAIIGENGAGKSTLVKCIMGVEKPQSGSVKMQYHGKWVTPKNAIEAKEYGMHANYQHVNIAKELSVAENYFLGRMPLKQGIVDWGKAHRESKKIIDQFSLNIDPRSKICDLPIANLHFCEEAVMTDTMLKRNTFIRGTIFSLVVIIALLFVISALGTETFFTAYNLSNIMRQCSITGVLAIAATLVIITGGIDLSCGAICGMSSLIVALSLTQTEMPIFLAIALAVLTGVVCGLFKLSKTNSCLQSLTTTTG